MVGKGGNWLPGLCQTCPLLARRKQIRVHVTLRETPLFRWGIIEPFFLWGGGGGGRLGDHRPNIRPDIQSKPAAKCKRTAANDIGEYFFHNGLCNKMWPFNHTRIDVSDGGMPWRWLMAC